MPRHLTIQQVYELLQVGERTVCEMWRQGKLPGGAKVGGNWRVDGVALREWFARGGEAVLPGEDC